MSNWARHMHAAWKIPTLLRSLRRRRHSLRRRRRILHELAPLVRRASSRVTSGRDTECDTTAIRIIGKWMIPTDLALQTRQSTFNSSALRFVYFSAASLFSTALAIGPFRRHIPVYASWSTMCCRRRRRHHSDTVAHRADALGHRRVDVVDTSTQRDDGQAAYEHNKRNRNAASIEWSENGTLMVLVIKQRLFVK